MTGDHMLESEQAQAIAEIKDRHEYEEAQIFRHGVQEDDKFNDIATLLEIVDSQAQRLADQAKTIEINAAYAIELQGKIAEHAKELAEARAIADTHRDTVMMYKFGNQPQRDDFPDESRIRNPWEAHA